MNVEMTTCRHCRGNIVCGTPQSCGACGKTRNHGDRLHCFSHCLEFIKAKPDEKLRMVRRNGDCTTCLKRGHDADAHMARNLGESPICGLYVKASGAVCTSIQNTVFHGSASHHTQSNNTKSQTRVIPQLTLLIDLGILLKGVQVSSSIASRQVSWEGWHTTRDREHGSSTKKTTNQ